MPHYLIKKQLQNTDKKHTKKMKKYLVNTQKVRKYTHTHTHTHTQLVDKGLNTASFCSHLYKCRQLASGKKSVKKYWIKPVKKLSLFELALGMVLGELGKV